MRQHKVMGQRSASGSRAGAGKLQSLSAEPMALLERVRTGVEQTRLATAGLKWRLQQNRMRWERQAVALGHGVGPDKSFLQRVTLLGSGTFVLLRAEAQRVFEDLVLAGEQSQQTNATLQPQQPVTALERVTRQRKVGRRGDSVAASAVIQQSRLSMEERMAAARKILAGVKTEAEEAINLQALEQQALEGDLRGARPAKVSGSARALFTARKRMRGMTPDEAAAQYEAIIRQLARAQHVVC